MRRTQTKKTVRNGKAREKCRFLLVEAHKNLAAIAVLAVCIKTSQYILSNNLCKPLEIYDYARKKHPSSDYPAVNHPKHSKFAITDMREKPVKFFYCSTQASTLVSAIILQTQVLLQKFPFLFIIIFLWFMLWFTCGFIRFHNQRVGNCKFKPSVFG